MGSEGHKEGRDDRRGSWRGSTGEIEDRRNKLAGRVGSGAWREHY